MRPSALLVAMLALAGCATAPSFSKLGVTPNELVKDRYECERDAVTAVPGRVVGGGATAVGVALVDRKHRVDFFSRCMQARGYATVERNTAATSPEVRLVADSPGESPRLALAREVVRASMGGSAGFDVLIGMHRDALSAMTIADLESNRAAGLSSAEKVKVREIAGRVFGELFPASKWEAEIAAMYARYLSEAELRDVLRFYQTPTGTRLGRIAPILAIDMARFGEEVGGSRELHERLASELRNAHLLRP